MVVSPNSLPRRSGATLGQAMDEAMDAIGHPPDVEVQDEPDSSSREPQVRQDLGVVDRRHVLDCLELDDHLVVTSSSIRYPQSIAVPSYTIGSSF